MTELLLDTCTFLWVLNGDERLSRRAAQAIADVDNEVYLSSASAWEISIKAALGKLELPEHPADYIPLQRERHGIEPLPIGEGAALLSARLPEIHRDPFDRILVCQALDLGMTLVSPDQVLRKYPVKILW